MGWLIALGVLTGLAILPLGAGAIYNFDGPKAYLLVGPVRIQLYPGKKKDKKSQKTVKKASPAKKASADKSKSTNKKGGSFTDFLPLVQTLLDLLIDFRTKIRVKRLELKLILAGGDPCDLAINYGRAWAALGNLRPQLERFFVIKKRDLEVACDFTADKTLVFAQLDLTITVGRLLYLVVRYGIRVLRQFLSIMKLRKGGAKT